MLLVLQIVMRIARMSNANFLAFLKRVALMMNGNLAFPSPVSPTLIEFATLITTYEDAMNAYGDVHNHGSTLQKVAMDDARIAAEQGVRGIAAYCQLTAANDRFALTSAGFDVTEVKVPIGTLPRVENFRQLFSNTVPYGAVKLDWDRPLGIKQGGVKTYMVKHSLTADVNSATLLALVTKTSFIDLEAGNRPSNFYWIVPVGTAGEGLISDVVIGFTTGPVVS